MRAARRSAALRIAGETLLVFVVVLAYLWLFRLYGFDLVDEGTQLAQIDRVAHGARPYVDFETGYTPWYFLLEVAIWRLAGTDLVATRTFGVLLHAGTVALLFACARAFCGRTIALCVAALDVAFLLPVSARHGAPFNTPYPAWLVAPLALGAQALVATVVRRRAATSRAPRWRDAASLLVCGALAGAGFSVKPNSGALMLAGATLALLPSWPARAWSARSLAAVVRVTAVAATLLLLGPVALDPAYAALLLPPLALAALRAGPAGADDGVAPLRDALALAAGFVAPVALWALPLLRALGGARFASDVLLLDGGVVGAYLLRLAPPDPAVLALCLGLVAGALLARGARRHAAQGRAERGLAPLALAMGLGVAAVLGGGEPRLTAEAACLWLGPVVLTLALLLVPRGPANARTHALLAFAAVYALQLFPRPDLMHVAMGGAPLLLAAAAAWRWFASPIAARRTSLLDVPLGAVAAGVVALLCAGRILPALEVRLTEPLVALEAGPRAPLVIAARHADEQRWLGEAVRAIDERSAPGDAVFYFPDLAGLGFLARRPAPFYYLYFVPGRPDRRGEARTVADLERIAPVLAVTGKPRVPTFVGAEGYFAALEAYLATHYRPVREVDGVTLSVRSSAPHAAAARFARTRPLA